MKSKDPRHYTKTLDFLLKVFGKEPGVPIPPPLKSTKEEKNQISYRYATEVNSWRVQGDKTTICFGSQFRNQPSN